MPSAAPERIAFPLKVDYHNIWCELKIKPNSENILSWFCTDLYQEVEHLLQDGIQEHIKTSKIEEPTFSNKDAKILLKGSNFKILYFFKPSKHLPPDLIYPMKEEVLWDNVSNTSLEENKFKNFGGLFKKRSILKFSVHATVEPLDNEDKFVNVAETKVTNTNYFQEIPVDKEATEKNILKRITHDMKKQHKLKKRNHKSTSSLHQTSNALCNYSQSTDSEATCEKEDTSNVSATSDDILCKNILSANDSKTRTVATGSEFTNSTRSQRPNKSSTAHEVQDNAEEKSNSPRKSPRIGQESRKLKKDKTSSVTSTFSATETDEDSPRKHNLRTKCRNVYYGEHIVSEPETPPKRRKGQKVANDDAKSPNKSVDDNKHEREKKTTKLKLKPTKSHTDSQKLDKSSSQSQADSPQENIKDKDSKSTSRLKNKSKSVKETKKLHEPKEPMADVGINLDDENSQDIQTCKLSPAKNKTHRKKTTSEMQHNDSFLEKSDRSSSSLCHSPVAQRKSNQSSLQQSRVSRLLAMFENNTVNASASDFACDKGFKLKKTTDKDQAKPKKKRELKWRIPPEYTRKKKSRVQGSLDSFFKASTSCQSSNSPKTSQGSLPGMCTGDEELVCMGKSYISDEQIQAEIDQIKDLKMLKEYQLKYLFKKYLPTLLKIQKGEVYSKRHEIYYGDSNQDIINLTFQVNFNLFTDDQVDYILELLMNEFSKTDYELVNYQHKVLLPEILIHMHMEITGFPHDKSDEIMAKAMFELQEVN